MKQMAVPKSNSLRQGIGSLFGIATAGCLSRTGKGTASGRGYQA